MSAPRIIDDAEQTDSPQPEVDLQDPPDFAILQVTSQPQAATSLGEPFSRPGTGETFQVMTHGYLLLAWLRQTRDVKFPYTPATPDRQLGVGSCPSLPTTSNCPRPTATCLQAKETRGRSRRNEGKKQEKKRGRRSNKEAEKKDEMP